MNSGNDCLSVTPKMANSDAYSNLENIWKNNSKKIIIAHLSVNSVRNKFYFLADIVKDNIDILMISEFKLDDSFPNSQLFMVAQMVQNSIFKFREILIFSEVFSFSDIFIFR